MKNTKWIIGIIIIAVLVIMFSGDKDKNVVLEDGPIKIGFVGPLTGDAASLGANALIAAELATAEINEAGGISGRELVLIAEDGKCSGKEASNAAQKLIGVDGVVGIVGGLCSSESSALVGLLNQSKVPAISTCSSAATLSDAGEYFFRTYPSDAYQGVFSASYIKETLGKQKVAIIYTNDDWGLGLRASFAETFTELGGEVVVDESFEKKERDLRTQLLKAQSSDAELIYFLGFNEATIPAITQYNELGLTIPMFGGDTWDDQVIWNEVADISEGFMYVVPLSKKSGDFKNKMAEAGVPEITTCAAQGYDNINIFASVIQEVGVNGEDIKNALHDLRYEGVSSDLISFDENGDLIGAEYVVKQNLNGEVVEL